MKISESWLREWVSPDIGTEALGHQLTMLGHEVSNIKSEGGDIGDIVIAEVASISKHPDADKLNLCKVDDGSGELINVVCGATNVVQGMKVPFARPGVRLPNGMKLRKAKIRGVVSYGMLCSTDEIGLGSESDGIFSLPLEAKIGSKLIDFLSLPDAIFDLDLTPNRGDCFSVLGIARDISVLTDADLKGPSINTVDTSIEDVQPIDLIEPTVCPRFVGRVIRGIDAMAKSPVWMTERLRRSGFRAISPIVDITNYVMLELGQPLHAYDSGLLQGIVRPRMAKKGENVTLLDEKVIKLNDDTMIIADDSGPIGIAGIMGGLKTAVTDKTTDVFLEAAFFSQDVMAGRARTYGMHTEASVRFERGVDPSGQVRAVERATELLIEITGGAAGPISEKLAVEFLPTHSNIVLRRERIRSLLGVSIDDVEVGKILSRLNMKTVSTSDGWIVSPPNHRFDISIEADLIEEVARIHGYDSIPETTSPSKIPIQAVTESKVDLEKFATTLVARDYQEVVTYSFINADANKIFTAIDSDLVLSNPISSEMSAMRSSLWPGLVAVAASNSARQQERIRLFEISKSFHGKISEHTEVIRIAGLITGLSQPEQWGMKSEVVDFYDIKSDVEAMLSLTCRGDEVSFRASQHRALQPGQSADVFRGEKQIGVVGKLHPKIAKTYDFKHAIYLLEFDAKKILSTTVPSAVSISKFPTIRRDIAVIVDDAISADELLKAVESCSPTLIKDIKIFDIYKGAGIEAGRKSIAMGLILQETSRTLTDDDADELFSAIIKKLYDQFKAELRD
ncbi:MAG: phenylalanine--tRNA ligase subunit beta [Woeseiaceae bacterium]|nr:phenylalanine--tRNA ligase subunit beta [Woeseiaceae bacterium]